MMQMLLLAVGWGFSGMHSGGGVGESPGAIKQQVIGLIHAVSYLKGKSGVASPF